MQYNKTRHPPRRVLFLIVVLLFFCLFLSSCDTTQQPLVLKEKAYLFNTDQTFKDVNITGNLHIDGNLSVKRPYAVFTDITNQMVRAASTPTPINFSNTEDSYLIKIASDRRNITVEQSGDYEFVVSAIVDTTIANRHAEIWIRKNGVDVARTNTRIQIPSTTTETLIVAFFIIDLMPTDVVTFMFASDDLNMQLLTTPATGYSPTSPGVILTVKKLSEIPTI